MKTGIIKTLVIILLLAYPAIQIVKHQADKRANARYVKESQDEIYQRFVGKDSYESGSYQERFARTVRAEVRLDEKFTEYWTPIERADWNFLYMMLGFAAVIVIIPNRRRAA